MKFDCCEDCYFYGVEPAICDICDDGDQFEPEDPDDDAFDKLLQLSKPKPKVIPIIPVHQDETEEEALKEAA